MSNTSLAISSAAARGDIPLLFSLLSKHRSTKLIYQNFLDLALRHAAENSQNIIVEALLRHGARVESPGHTPAIRIAARSGNPETVEVLLARYRVLPFWPYLYRRGKWMGAFLDAAAGGRVSVVRVMLKNGLDADLRYQCEDCASGSDAQGRCGRCRSESAIQLAAQYGHGEVVELLLHRGAKPGTEKAGEFTALHRAASRGFEVLVRQLLAAGWDANAADEGKKTPMYEAAVHHHKGTFNMLLEGGGMIGDNEGEYLHAMVLSSNSNALAMILPHLPPESFSRFAGTQGLHGDILQRAVDTKDAPIVRLILTYAKTHSLLSALDYTRAFTTAASSSSSAETIDLLITHCPWGQRTRTQHIFSFINRQAAVGHPDAVLQLIEWHFEFGQDVSLLETAFLSAIVHGQVRTVRELIETARVDINGMIVANRCSWEPGRRGVLYAQGGTALHFAAGYGRVDVCRVLIEYGAELNKRDEEGWTALHKAARNGQVETVALLIEHGAELEATSEKEGSTAMHTAASASYRGEEVVKCLWKAGVDIDARNSVGKTPLHLAALEWSGKAFDCLVSLGADTSVSDDDGLTPRQYRNRRLRGRLRDLSDKRKR
jgi:ankyrin repeat protein